MIPWRIPGPGGDSLDKPEVFCHILFAGNDKCRLTDPNSSSP